MSEKIFKDKKDLDDFTRKHSILDSRKFRMTESLKDFLEFMDELNRLNQTGDSNHSYWTKKLESKVDGKRKLSKMQFRN